MRNVTLITYADAQMHTSQELCVQSATEKGGINHYRKFDPWDIEQDADFLARNKFILKAQQRGGGFGFWLWKPYICEYMARITPFGEYIVYADAGVEFIKDIDYIINCMQYDMMGKDIWLFGNGHRHIDWCKKKVLDHMLPKGFDVSKEQIQASVIIFKVTEYTRDLMRRWLAWSEIPGFIDQSDNIGYDGFKDHRNDQAILTCLAIWDGIPLHWWPVQYGPCLKAKYPHDNYPQLFYHHRYREQDWKNNGLSIEQFMSQPKNI